MHGFTIKGTFYSLLETFKLIQESVTKQTFNKKFDLFDSMGLVL